MDINDIDFAERWEISVGDEKTTGLALRSANAAADPVLVLAHGAGAGMEHRNMECLAKAFHAHGLSVVRFNFLYMENKKGPPDRMPKLMETYSAVVDRVRKEFPGAPLFLGGHSMGGRTASMMSAEGFSCDGLVLVSYPLHPPGQPQKLRDAHLPQIQAPVIFINGTRDELCQRELMEGVIANLPSRFTMHWLEGADHGFRVQKKSGRTEEDVFKEIGETGSNWIKGITTSH